MFREWPEKANNAEEKVNFPNWITRRYENYPEKENLYEHFQITRNFTNSSIFSLPLIVRVKRQQTYSTTFNNPQTPFLLSVSPPRYLSLCVSPHFSYENPKITLEKENLCDHFQITRMFTNSSLFSLPLKVRVKRQQTYSNTLILKHPFFHGGGGGG